jgi:hypothetical protein
VGPTTAYIKGGPVGPKAAHGESGVRLGAGGSGLVRPGRPWLGPAHP